MTNEELRNKINLFRNSAILLKASAAATAAAGVIFESEAIRTFNSGDFKHDVMGAAVMLGATVLSFGTAATFDSKAGVFETELLARERPSQTPVIPVP